MQNNKLRMVMLAVIVALIGTAVVFNIASRSMGSGPATGAPASGTQAPLSSTAPVPSIQETTASSERAPAAQTKSAVPVPTNTATANETGQSTPAVSAAVPSASASAVEKPKLEVPATAIPSATTLPKSVERTPAIAGKIPPTGTAKGKLVEGFPTKALPVPDGARVIDSSVSTQNRNVQAAMNFRTSVSPEKVLNFYESQAAKKGWLATRGTTVDGSAMITLGYGDDTVVATVRTAATGTTIAAVFGSLKVGK